MNADSNAEDTGALIGRQLTDAIIGSYYTVYNELGYGFLENIYERALQIDLRERGLRVVSQLPATARYKGQVIGEYFIDLCVEDQVSLELKAAPKIVAAHEAQLLNYLRATGFQVGLVLNFSEEPEFSRKVLEQKHRC